MSSISSVNTQIKKFTPEYNLAAQQETSDIFAFSNKMLLANKHFLIKLLVYTVTAFLFTLSLTESLSRSAYTMTAVSSTEPQSPVGLLHTREHTQSSTCRPPIYF